MAAGWVTALFLPHRRPVATTPARSSLHKTDLSVQIEGMDSQNWPEHVPITRLMLTPDEGQTAEIQTAVGCSATQRIPVEIWHRILRLTIACALMIHEEDNFFHRRAVTDFECAKIFEYVKSERIRMNLRLVCRSWDTFLEQHSDRLVYHSWATINRPQLMTTWERATDPEYIRCGCREGCPLSLSIRVKIGGAGGDSVLWVETLDSLIRDYLLLNGSRRRSVIMSDFRKIGVLGPERFDSVRMLCGDLMMPGVVSASSYQTLIHLGITLYAPFDPSFRLNLPQLTSLNVSRMWGLEPDEDEGSINQPDIGCWDLPRLRYLTLVGNFQERGTYTLLHQVGRVVAECHFVPAVFRWRTPDTPVWKEIWPYLPALRVLGATFRKLATLSPPTNLQDGSISLVVHCDRTHGLFVQEEGIIAQFRRNWDTSVVDQVTINASWVEMIESAGDYPKGSRREVGETELKFLDILNGLGNGLRDRDGILLDKTIREQIGTAVERHNASREYGEVTRAPVPPKLSTFNNIE